MAARSTCAVLPLLTWPELGAIVRMEQEREALRSRIERLPRNSHRRVELEVRLRILTCQQLTAEADLEARR